MTISPRHERKTLTVNHDENREAVIDTDISSSIFRAGAIRKLCRFPSYLKQEIHTPMTVLRIARHIGAAITIQIFCFLCILVPLISAPLVLSGCNQTKSKYPPALRAFIDRYNKIRENMTEKEVDQILTGYVSFRRDEERAENLEGRLLKRKSVRVKGFEFNLKAREGNYVILIWFDKDGRVVGKSISEYCS